MSPTRTFHPYPSLPPELRALILHHAHHLTPPQTLPLHLQKSDLDYLRPHRPPCHNNPHILIPRLPIPSLLHAFHESRALALQFYTLGFDGGYGRRTLKMGRDDDDIEAFTTCVHELAASEHGRDFYWRPEIDIVVLDDKPLGFGDASWIFGGATGIRLPRLGRVMVYYDTFMGLGLGNGVEVEGMEELLVVVRGRGRGVPGEMLLGRGDVGRVLRGAGVRRGDGGEVLVEGVWEEDDLEGRKVEGYEGWVERYGRRGGGV
ncbi:hypothetical protein GLAREA_12006 [Glarea lozoyensis ATCC 20868]|uniref:2EXR domain-containing protein n=1 Tax=Glarea lozoyensis (strain ATCC 20868 / MF5171) TaxID=1116229 RepID=S3D485_GLAL2|nr:uncharacterized protein GLAREA_12006 [Glarea lozoyensis ATCC 20868]EPE31924.1 hypothetical protein GLAREA_12006 [Glarea lozoyensis ATCC 20868]